MPHTSQFTGSYSDDGTCTDSSENGQKLRPELGHSSSSATNSTGAISPWTPVDTLALSQMAFSAGSATRLKPLSQSVEVADGTRSFPTLVLGLLTALEADPAYVAHSLHSPHARSPASFRLGQGQAPAETEAILTSISRIADKLSRNDGSHLSDIHASSPAPGAFNHEAVGKLIGIQPPTSKSNFPTAGLSLPSLSHNEETYSSTSNIHAVAVENAEEDIELPSAEKELRQLKAQIKDFARVCKAVARGDLSQKVEVKVQGADLIELKEDINGMVEKLNTFANEGKEGSSSSRITRTHARDSTCSYARIA